jgi:hypothetical protein
MGFGMILARRKKQFQDRRAGYENGPLSGLVLGNNPLPMAVRRRLPPDALFDNQPTSFLD